MNCQSVNIYCDESCHLLRDQNKVMVLGAVACPTEQARDLAEQIRALKLEWGLSPRFEIKWTKISSSKADFYQAIVAKFFASPNLRFRALVVPDKGILRHDEFHQTHDEWYYKMYYDLLKPMVNERQVFNIYLDIKDTHGGAKTRRLQEVLANSLHDFDHEIVRKVQQVRSHDVELIQVADLLIGAVTYRNRGLSGNRGKELVCESLEGLAGRPLDRTTPLAATKVNLLLWQPRGA